MRIGSYNSEVDTVIEGHAWQVWDKFKVSGAYHGIPCQNEVYTVLKGI